MQLSWKLVLICIVLAGGIVSCKRNEQPQPDLSAVNKWILDSMRVYYYWADDIGKRQSDQPDADVFFNSLLNSNDRFSYLEDTGKSQIPTSPYGYYGFLYAIAETTLRGYSSLAMVTMTVPNGPAHRRGLKRGDVLLSVNGISFTAQNAENIRAVLGRGEALDLQVATISGNGLNNKRQLILTAGYFDSPPVFITKVFDNGSKKTGYIYYDEFKGIYDQSTLDSLAKFKQQGITDLIIDLRYNPGGDVSSIAKISAVIANVNRDEVFLISQANKNGGKIIDTFGQSIGKSAYLPISFSNIATARLNITKLYVLTSPATASSAELLINNLKPYMQVVQVGGQTLGKDMASFAINDQRQPKQVSVVLHPLIFKLYNADNKGDYPNGLMPDQAVNEFTDLPLKAFGDPEDPLIHKALELSLGSMPVVMSRKVTGVNSIASAIKTVYLSADERSRIHKPMVLPAHSSSFKKK